jgi:hypothetical protein
VGPRAGLDTEATGKILSHLPEIEPRLPGHPVRSQTLLTELPGSHLHLEILRINTCCFGYLSIIIFILIFVLPYL